MELRDLKVGDEVAVENSRWQASPFHLEIAKIKAITPKGFIKVNENLYNPETGNLRSSNSWNYSSISVLTEKLRNEIKDAKDIYLCKSMLTGWSQKLNGDTARKIIAFFNELSK